MTTDTLPAARQTTLSRWAGRAVSVLGKAAASILRPHKASLVRLTDIPLTVAGLGCVDAGVFTASTIAGWIVTGLSLVVLEHLIADPE